MAPMMLFILDRENVFERAVVSLRPQVSSGGGLNKLARNAKAIAGFSDTAFEHIAHSEFAADLFDVYGVALVGKAGVPGDDEEPTRFRKRSDNVLGNSVGKVFLLRVTAHVLKCQDCDRRLVGKGEGLNRRRNRTQRKQ